MWKKGPSMVFELCGHHSIEGRVIFIVSSKKYKGRVQGKLVWEQCWWLLFAEKIEATILLLQCRSSVVAGAENFVFFAVCTFLQCLYSHHSLGMIPQFYFQYFIACGIPFPVKVPGAVLLQHTCVVLLKVWQNLGFRSSVVAPCFWHDHVLSYLHKQYHTSDMRY